MTAALLAVAGVACLVVAALVLRSLGSAYRVGRLLSSVPGISIDEAISVAESGAPRFVRVAGRIASDEEFPDENDRPLVFRRTRIELADGRGGWQRVLDDREAVPFGIEVRTAYIAVDAAALGEGLVVIPRESTGVVRDVPPDLTRDLPTDIGAGLESAGLDPSMPARLIVDQVSAVEHATVAGQPVIRDGRPLLTAGLGRPLILTTLEVPAAMRILAHSGRGRLLLAAVLLVAGLGLLAAAVVALLAGV